MAPQTVAAPNVPSRSRMWHKSRDARSRTPSPMYLELQRPNIFSVDDASSGESGGHTPRENVWTAAQGMPTWQQSLKEMGTWDGSKEARQVKSYGEPKPTQFAVGPYPSSQEQTWSALSAAVRPGYQGGSGNLHVGMKTPLPSRQLASNAFPIAHDMRSRQNNFPEAGNYKGYVHADAEIIRSLANQQMPWAPERQFHGTADLSALMQGNLDRRAEPAAFVPPPPSSFVPPPPAAFVQRPPPGLDGQVDEVLPSIGTRGHPHTCENGCKYVWKKKGCRDGAACPRCHLCHPKKEKSQNSDNLQAKGNNPQAKVNQAKINQAKSNQEPSPQLTKPTVSVSVGSIGHPHSCAPACKYNGKKTGCKDGQLCDRCHICRWTRCKDRATDRGTNADAEVVGETKAPPSRGATKEMSTQTSVDSCTQCDLDEEFPNQPVLGVGMSFSC